LWDMAISVDISVTGGRGMDEVDEAVVSMHTIIYLSDSRSATSVSLLK